MRAHKKATPFLLGCLALLASVLVGILYGSVQLGGSSAAVGKALLDALPLLSFESGLSDSERNILLNVRLPRVVLGCLVGAALAMSGATYQGVFRNPLADPYLLGVASGAGLGATIALVFSLPFTWGPLRPVAFAAFLGALGAVALVSVLGRSRNGDAARLLLAGIAIVAFLTAIQTYVLHRNRESIAQVFGWILGGLTTSGWSEVLFLAPYVLVCGVVLLAHGRHLDVFSVGEQEASSLGLHPVNVRWLLIITATLLTASAVAVSGLISFVGIIIPHAMRLLFGASYRKILPLSVLYGAAFLVFADIGSRTISGSQLPISVITASIGAPFFAAVLFRRAI